MNAACGVHGPIPCEGAGCICNRSPKGQAGGVLTPVATVWEPEPNEAVASCLDNSLKRAAQLLRSTGHPGDAIDASRIEYLRANLDRPSPAPHGAFSRFGEWKDRP